MLELIDNLKLLLKLICMNEFIWLKLPESGFVKGRLATREDYYLGNASFFSVPVEDPNIPATDIKIPQYALYRKKRWLKVPCIIIQAEGKNKNYLIGYKNLLNGENDVGWIDEFELLGDNVKPKNKW